MVGEWRQYHGDGPNKGFSFVSTLPADVPKWQAYVGPVGYGSPVLGPKGVIYIGTLKGELVAVSPKGVILWSRELSKNSLSQSVILGSPAIDKNGNIYVIATVFVQAPDKDESPSSHFHYPHSILYSYDALGNERWACPFPSSHDHRETGGYTFSSPKIFSTKKETYIFYPRQIWC